MEAMKTCRRCKESKQVGVFGNHGGMADGRNSICRDCFNAEQKAYYYRRKDNRKGAGVAEAIIAFLDFCEKNELPTKPISIRLFLNQA